jgi:hypothetical protein
MIHNGGAACGSSSMRQVGNARAMRKGSEDNRHSVKKNLTPI